MLAYKEMNREELKKELETMAPGAMRNEANEYLSLEQEKMKLSAKREDWRYVLFPVWTLTYPGKDGKSLELNFEE